MPHIKKHSKLSKSLSIYLPILLSAAIFVWLVYPNFNQMLGVIKKSTPSWLILSLFFSVSSYFFMALMLWEVLRILKNKVKFIPTAAITLVSTVVNYFISSAGASGFVTRVHLLGKRGVSYGSCVTSSVVITVLIYVSLAAILAGGALLQFLQSPNFGKGMFESILGVGLVICFAALLMVMFFNDKLRLRWGRKIFIVVNLVVYFFARKRLIPYEQFKHFKEQLDTGIATVNERKEYFPKLLAYVFCDWISNMLILYFAFKAVGVSLSASTLVIGFAIGMLMTVIPILPGGLGAMEAAMTAAFSGMGIDTASALTASLIFRIFYYLLPGFISIFVYWMLKVSENKQINVKAV